MRVLMAIFGVAFLALVWASVAMARYVQQARQRNRTMLEQRARDLAH